MEMMKLGEAIDAARCDEGIEIEEMQCTIIALHNLVTRMATRMGEWSCQEDYPPKVKLLGKHFYTEKFDAYKTRLDVLVTSDNLPGPHWRDRIKRANNIIELLVEESNG